ncbi:MAG: hydantoinase/oxoprolinase family protein [Geminicoccaceae bacterium]
MSIERTLRLAVDIGGTFTDTVLIEGADRVLASTKTLTTHGNPADGAMAGVRKALEQAKRRVDEVTGFIHGTTLATNALIEKRGARVATVATEGFRDILDIAYERRYSQYDINLEKPDRLVSHERSFTIRERMSAAGRVLIDLDQRQIDDLLAALDRAGAEAVAICLLHAYANPSHETRLRERLMEARPDLAVSISSEVSPEAREFDRLSTTVANAYIRPLMARYLAALETQFRVEGIACPILVMTASGGMTTIDTAMRLPIRLVESGPAGGAILASRVAEDSGLNQVLSFDMGGTTAKLCLIDQARPQTSRQFEIARAARFVKGSGMPVRIPVIEMIEIGAGGGSIAGVDVLGRLVVGPKSAGSEPGPAAFGRGGTDPTVTDADIALGYVRPETFAEGQFRIDTGAAAQAIDDRLGAALGLDASDAADGISRMVDESMASASRMHAVESGKDLKSRTMIAFGGNGPLHACRLARLCGISRVLIPANPGVGSALGFLFAPVSFETVHSMHARLECLDVERVNALFADMIEEATGIVRQGAPDGRLDITRTAFMRYCGQGHEVEITLPERDLCAGDIEPLTNHFEDDYSRQFSRPVPGMSIEILNWAVRVSSQPKPPVSDHPEPVLRDVASADVATIHCDLSGRAVSAGVVSRATLEPGDVLSGPALITEPQTTTFVGADFKASVDARGNLVLMRERAGG